MTEQIIEAEADSLEEARNQIKSQIPDGLSVLSEKVVSSGDLKTITAVADTVEMAFANAQSKIPSNANILSKREILPSERKVIAVEAFDEQNARVWIGRNSSKTTIIKTLKPIEVGSKGFLGFGKKPNKYEAEVFQQAMVEITYKPKAKISVEVGKGKKTIATVFADFLIKHEKEFEKLDAGGLVLLDSLRDIVNSGFSQASIQKALHQDYQARELVEEFLREIDRLKESNSTRITTARHAIIQSGNTRYIVDESRLRKELEGQIAFVLDLKGENIEELLITGKTEVVSFIGQKKSVTIEYCDCPDMASHKRA